MRCALTLSYDGSAFSGWQIQNNAPSVQGALESALSTLFGCPVSVVGAGRTDAGVNAINYVAHFDFPEEGRAGTGIFSSDPELLCYKLNAILPEEVAVHTAKIVSDEFHARFSASARQYKYYIHNKKDPFKAAFSWYCRFPLDIDRMNAACSFLPGVHDCSCFEKKGSDNASSVCNIMSASWTRSGDSLVFTIEANRFLRNMVRAIVGTLVDIGRGVHEPEYIVELFNSGSRSDAGQSVPGHALFLTEVRY